MEMRQLYYFAEVAKSGNYSKAAENLFLSRQALSKAIKNLEQELGESLFIADNKQKALTSFGERLLKDAEPLMNAYDTFSAVYLNGQKQTKSLSLAVAHGTTMTLKDRLIETFREQNGDVILSIEETFTDDVLDLTRSGSVDIGLVGSRPTYLEGFDYQLVTKTGIWLNVPNQSVLAHKEKLVIDDLRDQSIVTTGKRNHLHRYFIELCETAGFEPRIELMTSDTDMLVRYAYDNKSLYFTFPEQVAPSLYPLPEEISIIPLDVPDFDIFGTYAIRSSEPLGATSVLGSFWTALANSSD